VTDPRGRCFISYRRSRANEVSELGRKLRSRGVPLWVDISDLGPGSTEELIIEVLEDDACACGVAWVTPEVADSSVIRRVEVPGILRRARRRDGFFAVMAVAGGLDYPEAAQVAAENLGTTDLSFWNMDKVEGDPAPAAELDRLADAILRQRLSAVVTSLLPAEPLRVGLWVRRGPPDDQENALQMDWDTSFTGRTASVGAWEAELLPALRSVHREVARSAGHRGVVADGHPTLAAALALGRAFPAVAGIHLAWEQVAPDGSRCQWSLAALPEGSGYDVSARGIDPGGDGLAVLVSVMHDATLAFGATPGLPTMRAAVEVAPSVKGRGEPLTPGGARQLSHEIVDAIRSAKTDYQGVREIHLFLACPVGLAVMLGQLLNALGPITVYEHVDEDTVGHYRPELRIPSSGLS
jgi:hypothetical protein